MRVAFSSLASPAWSVEEIADAARRFAYVGVEWRLADGEILGPRTPDVVWERIASCGVPTPCLDASAAFVQPTDELRAKAVRHTVAMAARAVQIGAPAVRVFAGAIPEGSVRDDVIKPARDALAQAAVSVPDGVSVLVETHDSWSSGADVVRLTSGIEGVGVLWDVAHTLRNGEAPSRTLEHTGTPGLVHLKDAIGTKLTLFGEGELEIDNVIGALRGAGYDGWMSIELEKLWHPYLPEPNVALPHSRAYVARLLGAEDGANA